MHSNGVGLPVYLLADEYGPAAAVEATNAGLSRLLDVFQEDPIASSRYLVSVAGFADTVRCHLPLTSPLDLESLPGFQARGTGPASYASAFDWLRATIRRDVARLKADDYAVHRPVAIFFVSRPLDAEEDWTSAHRDLTDHDFREHPYLAAIGLDAVPVDQLQQLARPSNLAFVVRDSAGTAGTVIGCIETVVAKR